MPWMLFGPIMLSLFAIACVLAVMYVTSMVQRCGIGFFQARDGFVHGSARPHRDRLARKRASESSAQTEHGFKFSHGAILQVCAILASSVEVLRGMIIRGALDPSATLGNAL